MQARQIMHKRAPRHAGEKQRVACARAILKNPRVLLLVRPAVAACTAPALQSACPGRGHVAQVLMECMRAVSRLLSACPVMLAEGVSLQLPLPVAVCQAPLIGKAEGSR